MLWQILSSSREEVKVEGMGRVKRDGWVKRMERVKRMGRVKGKGEEKGVAMGKVKKGQRNELRSHSAR